jgi:hypothetical protein
VQAGRCNSAMQHVIVVYSRRQIGFSVCPSSILKFKNERGKKIVTGAGSQVFSDRLGYPYFYLVDSMGAHRRARIHPPCSALPGRCDLLSPASDPSEVQNGTHEGLKEGIDQRRQVVVSVQPYKNASTDYSERETLKKCMASPVRGRGC